MLRGIDGTADLFLADLDRTQSVVEKARRQVSSGLKIERPSDAPDQLVTLLQLRAEIAQNDRIQVNLTQAKSVADTAESALEAAAKLMDTASTLATQGATSLSTAQDRASMAQELQGIQEQLVGLSRSSTLGSFVFSGDRAQEPAYELNLAAPTGVNRLLQAPSTQQTQDADGVPFVASRTAQDIFDHRNPDDSVATDNVFSAVNGLRVALLANDAAGIKASIDSLHAAADSLNVNLGFYGGVQNRISDSLNRASSSEVLQKSALSGIQDADLPAATIAMSLGQVQQQASLAAQAKMPKTSLFDFLA